MPTGFPYRAVILPLAFVVLTPVVRARMPDAFDDRFSGHTMRVDYFHTAGNGSEIVALDRVVGDGPWPGSRSRLIDTTNRGKYLFEVSDPTTNEVIYSRGFSSLCAEWETTSEAKSVNRTFHESLRFPWPKAPVRVALKRRGQGQSFSEIWSVAVDPDSRSVNRADVKAAGELWTIFDNGPAADKVDLVIVGEGYTAAELPKFHADAGRLVDALFATEPFKSRKADFNVRAIDLPSEKSGVNRPHAGAFRRTLLSAEYNIFDTERYLLTYDNRALRDVTSSAPYEFVEILANEQAYGGGGIYNFQATASVDNEFAEYVFIHEFGHHFAGLGDEYYTSDVAYETGLKDLPEPWEPNITALKDPANLKWRDLVDAGTPLPTPWQKDVYESHSREIQRQRRALIGKGAPQSEVDALFRSEEVWETRVLGEGPYAGKVGAFEGAMYERRALYRPQSDCIMFTRDKVGFCRVCARAIEQIIDLYARP